MDEQEKNTVLWEISAMIVERINHALVEKDTIRANTGLDEYQKDDMEEYWFDYIKEKLKL